MKPHDKIWLEPECDGCDERCWSSTPFDDCEECGKETIGYVRDDIVLAASQEASRMFDRIEKLEAAVKKVLSQCSWYRTDQWCAGLDCRCIVLVSAMQEELNTSQERVNKTGET